MWTASVLAASKPQCLTKFLLIALRIIVWTEFLCKGFQLLRRSQRVLFIYALTRPVSYMGLLWISMVDRYKRGKKATSSTCHVLKQFTAFEWKKLEKNDHWALFKWDMIYWYDGVDCNHDWVSLYNVLSKWSNTYGPNCGLKVVVVVYHVISKIFNGIELPNGGIFESLHFPQRRNSVVPSNNTAF